MIGDTLASALSLVGLTAERVEHWLGRPCGCEERKAKLNALGHWATRVLQGRREKAGEYLQRIMGDQPGRR